MSACFKAKNDRLLRYKGIKMHLVVVNSILPYPSIGSENTPINGIVRERDPSIFLKSRMQQLSSTMWS